MFLISWYTKPVLIYNHQLEVVKTLDKAAIALPKKPKLSLGSASLEHGTFFSISPRGRYSFDSSDRTISAED